MMNKETMEEKHGELAIVATPIGNLGDITLRALDSLKAADVIFAEDTRVIARLLAHYEIRKSLLRYDEHAHERASEEVLRFLREGKRVVFVSDAGTPGIADPGSRLVARVRAEEPAANIIPIPGASAITTLLSVSGLSADQFVFLGFPPHKKGRKTFFENLTTNTIWPAVFYESPHRIGKALASIREVLGDERRLIVGRELTKVHEEIFTGTVKEAAGRFGGEEGESRGEFAVVVAGE